MFQLNYGDCATLTDEDLDTLSPASWLGDNVISFYLEYLEHHIFSAHLTRSPGKAVFLGPATTQMFHLLSVEDGLSLGGLDLTGSKAVFLPVNNCDDPGQIQGGSHWSLLVFDVERDAFYHFDSAGGMNKKSAKIVAARLHQLVRGRIQKGISVDEVQTPRQTNGYDCGLYVLHIAETLAGRVFGGEEISSPLSIDPKAVSNLRSEIKKILLSLEAASKKS